ncbi:MAG: cytochrome c peroxidase [Planctomycetota bacterium]
MSRVLDRRAPAALAGALMLLAAAHSAQTDAERPLVPEDTLPTPFVRAAPLGVEELEAGFTASDEEFALGRRLFFDPILSPRRTVACASCHRPDMGFADDRKLSRGIEGYLTRRNAPSLLNKGLSENVLWDGRAATLEDQVLMPIENPEEMALGKAAAVNRLGADEAYSAEFKSVFDREVDEAALASALASFVRGLTAGDSPVDRFRDGDVEALTVAEEAGLWIFEGKGRCWRCHSGPNFSDESFHNTGVGAVDGEADPGRGAITGEEADMGRFRTPGLRMLTETAPYMHDGSLATLEDVVEFYRDGGNDNPHLSDRLEKLELSDKEAAQLVAFLKALSR